MKKLILFTLSLLLAFGLQAQDRAAQKERIESMRVAFLTDQLELSPDEAKAFWPIYEKYADERRALRREQRRSKSVEKLTEAQAEALIEGTFEQDEKEIALKKKYYQQLYSVVPKSKIAKLEGAEKEFKRQILKAIKKRKAKQ